jgi:hypothetical protein
MSARARRKSFFQAAAMSCSSSAACFFAFGLGGGVDAVL